MSRNHETRLQRLEAEHAEVRETHEERLERMDAMPPMTAAESARIDAEIIAEAIAEFGSLAAAALAGREHAKATKDPYEDLRAGYLEYLDEIQAKRTGAVV